jgi:hypothetical protein
MSTKDTEIIAIRKSWNAGLNLSETFKRLQARYGFDNKAKLIAEWRELKRLFGCKSAPASYVNGWYGPNIKPAPLSESELNQIVTVSMYGSTYGNWKGSTGPGALLRKILSEERKENERIPS